MKFRKISFYSLGVILQNVRTDGETDTTQTYSPPPVGGGLITIEIRSNIFIIDKM